MSDEYKQAKSDYNYIVKNYGFPEDMTGGFVEGDYFIRLLERPTKAHARDIYINLIEYGISVGFDSMSGANDAERLIYLEDIEDDERITEILERYEK